MNEADMEKTVEDVKRRNCIVRDRFLSMDTTCNDAVTNMWTDLLIHNETFKQCKLVTVNSGNLVRGMRKAYFGYSRLSLATLAVIAKQMEPDKMAVNMFRYDGDVPPSELARAFVFLDSMQRFARHVEARIDRGDEYIWVQPDAMTQPDSQKRENVLFELRAFRRYHASRCGRPGCTVVRSPTQKKMFDRCGRCFTVHYCSRTCQALHWKTIHRAECQPTSPAELYLSFLWLGMKSTVRSTRRGIFRKLIEEKNK